MLHKLLTSTSNLWSGTVMLKHPTYDVIVRNDVMLHVQFVVWQCHAKTSNLWRQCAEWSDAAETLRSPRICVIYGFWCGSISKIHTRMYRPWAAEVTLWRPDLGLSLTHWVVFYCTHKAEMYVWRRQMPCHSMLRCPACNLPVEWRDAAETLHSPRICVITVITGVVRFWRCAPRCIGIGWYSQSRGVCLETPECPPTACWGALLVVCQWHHSVQLTSVLALLCFLQVALHQIKRLPGQSSRCTVKFIRSKCDEGCD